jgi:hypothetical protein
VDSIEVSLLGVIKAGAGKGIYGDLLFKAEKDTNGHLQGVVEAHVATYAANIEGCWIREFNQKRITSAIGQAQIFERLGSKGQLCLHPLFPLMH